MQHINNNSENIQNTNVVTFIKHTTTTTTYNNIQQKRFFGKNISNTCQEQRSTSTTTPTTSLNNTNNSSITSIIPSKQHQNNKTKIKFNYIQLIPPLPKHHPPSFSLAAFINKDIQHKLNPQYNSEYLEDIYTSLLSELQTNKPHYRNFLSNQPELTMKIRNTLIDWLISIHSALELLPETLYLTLIILDRYIEHVRISKSNFQLIGCVCMFIAAKNEEIYPPSVIDFIYFMQNAFTYKEFVDMEINVLNAVDFDLLCTYPHVILQRLFFMSEQPSVVYEFALFLLECSYFGNKCLTKDDYVKVLGVFYFALGKLRKEKGVDVEKIHSGIKGLFGKHKESIREFCGGLKECIGVIKKEGFHGVIKKYKMEKEFGI